MIPTMVVVGINFFWKRAKESGSTVKLKVIAQATMFGFEKALISWITNQRKK